LDDYFTHTSWGLMESDLIDFDALALAQGRADDHQIALPMLRNAPVLYLNQTWAEELGFTGNPQTFADFSAIACAAQAALLADTGNNGTGGWIISTDENAVLSWLSAYGFDDLSPADGTFRFDVPEAEEAMTDLWTLTSQGCAWLSRQPAPYDYFATRRAVLFSGTLRDVDTVQRALDLAGSSDEWVLLPYPGVQTSPALVQGSPEEQLAGWLFISWLMESKNQALLSISTHSLPVRESALPWMQVYFEKFPQWRMALEESHPGESLPLHPNWMSAGNLLEDAAWQLFQPYTRVEEIPLILQQLDAMIAEYENRE
jgi:ABC-type glycerol-3-phosphate transport system substrate-binding protein